MGGRFRKKEIECIRERFVGRNERQKAAELRVVIINMGYFSTGDQMAEFLERFGGANQEVDMWGMEHLCNEFRHEIRDRTRSSHGFNAAEVAKHQAIFNKHDPNDTGMLCGARLRDILKKILPNVATSIE